MVFDLHLTENKNNYQSYFDKVLSNTVLARAYEKTLNLCTRNLNHSSGPFRAQLKTVSILILGCIVNLFNSQKFAGMGS